MQARKLKRRRSSQLRWGKVKNHQKERSRKLRLVRLMVTVSVGDGGGGGWQPTRANILRLHKLYPGHPACPNKLTTRRLATSPISQGPITASTFSSKS